MSNGFEPGRADEPDSEDEALLVEWAADLAVRIREGQPVDWTELGEQHPEQAERLPPDAPGFLVDGPLGRLGRIVIEPAILRPPICSGSSAASAITSWATKSKRGGMGVVYEGYQISLKRRVALKILPAAGALDPRQLQRFQIEAQAKPRRCSIIPISSRSSRSAPSRGVPFLCDAGFIEGRHNWPRSSAKCGNWRGWTPPNPRMGPI